MICPCKDCTERYEACHDHCDKYKDWKAPIAASYADRKKQVINKSEVLERWMRRELNHRKRQGK